MFRKYGMVLALLAASYFVGAVRAEEEADGGKGKGKGAAAPAPKMVQIDLSKLPPDLAKALMKYAVGQDAKAKAVKAPAAPIQLPPGLAKKPADHPGRTHYIQHVLKKAPPGAPAKGAPHVKPAKKKSSQEDDE